MDAIESSQVIDETASFSQNITHHARKPLKICLLGYRSDPLGGGQGIYLYYLSKALVELGHQVDVMSGPPYPNLDERVQLIKVPSLDLYRYFPDMWKQWDWSYLRSATDLYEYLSIATGGFPELKTFGRRVAKYFAKEQPEYDVVHDNQSLCYGLLDVQRMGYPVLSTFHHPITKDLKIALDNEPKWGKRLLLKRWHRFLTMQQRVVPRLKNIVAVSDSSKRDIETDFTITPNTLRVIANGIDTDCFVPPQNEGVREAQRLICTSSSDSPLKGLKYLLMAFAELLQEWPELRLTLVGKPKSEGENAKLIDQLGIRDAIDFRSEISTQELVAEYQRATIAVCPSIYEGFGLPVGEAMACGTPVVSTDGGALAQVVGNAGILVGTKNIQALVEAISSLLGSQELRDRLSIAGRLHIEREFSWSRAAERFSELYEEAIVNADR